MIDIIKFNYKGKEKFGFSRFHNFKDFKIALGTNDKANRKAIENKNTDIITSLEKLREKDFMHYRDSGLNQVLCKIIKKNNITVGFNFNDVLTAKNRAQIIGKMTQNIKLCRKYKVKMAIFSGATNQYELRSAKDLISFGITLGMTPGEAQKTLNFKKKTIK